ncbi:hypothetical protein BC940DRAFT_316425 [Gongronella butleri]|nr:hypothetical protein BC940DRAFT_316425 [Gongronella butleri]
MIVGGQGPSTTNVSGLNTIAARFNADRNQWTSLGAMQAPNTATTVHNSLNSLTFGAQIVPLSSTELFLMGGTPSSNQTVYSGWSQYVYMNATNSTLNQYVAKYGPAASSSQRLFNHAMATDVDGRVYIFGGVVTANASANNYKTYSYANMNSSSVYSNFSFATLKTSGALPVNRQLHTTTSLPTNKILLYGGFNDDNQVLNDACYIYDAASKTWAAANFTNGIGPGPRYGHAAVLVGTELLYIIGGVDSTGQARGDVSILNTTSMTWLGPDEIDTNGSSSSGSASGGGLHGGAIAGVVIGVLAAVKFIVISSTSTLSLLIFLFLDDRLVFWPVVSSFSSSVVVKPRRV